MNEKTLIKARNELKQHNLIDFRPGKKKGEITEYGFVNLYDEEKAVNKPAQNTPQHTPKRTPYHTPQRTPQCTDILNININANSSSNVRDVDDFTMVVQEFGRPLSPTEVDQIKSWLHDDQTPSEIIKLAIRKATALGKCFISFIDGILRNWRKQNLMTVELIEAHEKRAKGDGDGGNRKRQTAVLDSEISKVFDRSAFEFKADAL